VKTFESLRKNILEPNKATGWEIDIFIHTWDEKQSNNQRDYSEKEKLSTADIDLIKKLYSPKKLLVEPQIKINGHLHHIVENIEIPKSRIHNTYYTMHKTNKLRREYENKNVKYDFVIATRMDIDFCHPILIDNLREKRIEQISPRPEEKSSELFTAIYFGTMPGFPFISRNTTGVIRLGASDCIMCGAGKLFDESQDVYLHLDEMLDKYGFENHEYFIKHWWDDIGINVIVLNYIFGLDWSINRSLVGQHKRNWWKKLWQKK
jgi:hypothetical protein